MAVHGMIAEGDAVVMMLSEFSFLEIVLCQYMHTDETWALAHADTRCNLYDAIAMKSVRFLHQ